jgi:hypothetical protein
MPDRASYKKGSLLTWEKDGPMIIKGVDIDLGHGQGPIIASNTVLNEYGWRTRLLATWLVFIGMAHAVVFLEDDEDA